jgi:hypothetical protein
MKQSATKTEAQSTAIVEIYLDHSVAVKWYSLCLSCALRVNSPTEIKDELRSGSSFV